jgi:hypothetical protein
MTMDIYTKAAKKLFDLGRQKAGPFPGDGSEREQQAYFDLLCGHVERLGALHHLSAVGLIHHFLNLESRKHQRKATKLAAEADAQDQLLEELAIMQQDLGMDDRNTPVIAIFRAYLAKHPDEKARLAAMCGEIAFFASEA